MYLLYSVFRHQFLFMNELYWFSLRSHSNLSAGLLILAGGIRRHRDFSNSSRLFLCNLERSSNLQQYLGKLEGQFELLRKRHRNNVVGRAVISADSAVSSVKSYNVYLFNNHYWSSRWSDSNSFELYIQAKIYNTKLKNYHIFEIYNNNLSSYLWTWHTHSRSMIFTKSLPFL